MLWRVKSGNGYNQNNAVLDKKGYGFLSKNNEFKCCKGVKKRNVSLMKWT